MPGLSIVIPCLGGAPDFDGTLVSVLQHRPSDCEVLVVHTDAYEDPYDLAGEVKFLRCQGQRRVAELVNEGLFAAAGEVVHVIGCGIEATDGWTQAALKHFDDPEVAAVSPIIVAASDGRLISAGLRCGLAGAPRVVADQRLLKPGTGRLRASILGSTLAAGFYRRSVLAALEGFDAAMGDWLADVDLALSLRALGRLHVCEPAARLVQSTETRASRQESPFAMGRAAQHMLRRHPATRSLAAVMALYPLGLIADLARQGISVSTAACWLGRAVGAFEPGQAVRHQERIERAKQRLEELAELRATIRLPASRATAASPQRRAA